MPQRISPASWSWAPSAPAALILPEPEFSIPLSPFCQGALRPGQVTAETTGQAEPGQMSGIGGQEEADEWPGQRMNRVGQRPKDAGLTRIIHGPR